MNPAKTIAYLAAAILVLLGLAVVFFGVMYIWSSFSPQAQSGWLGIGLITTIIGLGMIGGAVAVVFLASRSRAGEQAQNVTLNVDLPANVNLDTLKCKSCGGVLSMENIQMVAGAPVVNCPYCKTTYQLTEEPKW